MAKRSKRTRKSQAKLQDLVVVTFVTELEQAKEYETLLKNNDIPAVITEHEEGSMESEGLAVMVPEEFLDEAHVVIESQDVYDEFYDFALDDKDADEFDTELFEDDF
jgi:hypothetical protein